MSNPIGELIASGEGSYNSYNRGTRNNEHGKYQIIPSDRDIDFTEMTISEIKRHQNLSPGDPERFFAVGKYQFTRDTLGEAVDKLRIDPSEKFTEEMQERLFYDYLIKSKTDRHAIYAYITDESGATLHAAQIAVSREWASVEDPDTPGHVYKRYEKFGNKMHTTAAQVATALDEMRVEYKAQIDKGLSSEEAWRATASMGPGSFEHTAHAQRPRSHVSDPVIQALQENLNTLGYTDADGRELVADGRNGRHTREAVEAFQRDHGLSVDGKVGPRTLAVLSKVLAAPAIGQPDAPYLRDAQTPDTLAGYRAFTSPMVPSVTETPSAVAPPPANEPASASMTFPAVAPIPGAATIRALQEELNTIGLTDHRGQPMSVSGIYDAPTRFAVMGFQHDHDLLATGIADPATLALVSAHARIAELQAVQPTARAAQPDVSNAIRAPMALPAMTAVTSEPVMAPTAMLRPFSDPTHPQHGIYAELEKLLPAGTSPERLTQATAACHQAGIDKPQDLASIVGNDNAILFTSRSLVCQIGEMDISQPAPSIQQTMQQVEQFDQQREQHHAQFQAQQAQINAQAQQGPVLGGR